MPRAIAQTPTQAYAMINPAEALPSGDERYVDLDAVRGTRNVARLLIEIIHARTTSGGGWNAQRLCPLPSHGP
jgi:hypothetical protein